MLMHTHLIGSALEADYLLHLAAGCHLVGASGLFTFLFHLILKVEGCDLLIFLLAYLVVAWALLQSAAGSSAKGRYAQGSRNMDTVDTWYPDNLIFGRQSEAKQRIS
jgi:hypothetical protein